MKLNLCHQLNKPRLKPFRRLLLLGVVAVAGTTTAAPLAGTKSVGPTGDYASLTEALADVQAVGNGLGGALILELQPTYTGTVETYPLSIPTLTGASAMNTLTIRPAHGATGLSLSSASTETVDLNGGQFVTIDGRPGGIGSNAGSGGGTASQLTIANTSTSGVALRFINEASSNTIRYTTLQAVNTSTGVDQILNFSSGVIFFSTTTGANGNDGNILDHCDIGDGASTPANTVYSSGSPAPADNSRNTISNCNIFNFHSRFGARGVQLDVGNTAWSITGNSFYQTANRAATAALVYAIGVGNSFGNNFTITGNFIGGSAPNAGGAPWKTTGTLVSYNFVGIWLDVGTATPSSVQGNSIANMIWTSSQNDQTAPSVWSGIFVSAGNVNIGTETGNIIGSGTGTDSITTTTSGDGGASFGIASASRDTVNIANNTIGSITTKSTRSTVAASLFGIQVSAGGNTISNNLVGSLTTAKSLNASSVVNQSTSGQHLTGILSTSSTSSTITGNIVANLFNNLPGNLTSSQPLRGIATSAGVNTIRDNTVRNLTTFSPNLSIGSLQSVLGIVDTSTVSGQTVSENTVHSLANLINTTTTLPTKVAGIYFSGPTSGVNVVSRNRVHSLDNASPDSTSAVKGIEFGIGTFTAQNNVVRVGLAADGTSAPGASLLYGIWDNGTTDGRNFYHNSVYIGGTGQTSYAFSSIGVSNARDFRNNLFVNARGGYAVNYGGTTPNPTGLTANGNLFLASGAGTLLGRYNSTDYTTLTAWQIATGQDANSLNTDPLFVNPTGDAGTLDLHLQAASPAIGAAVTGTGVTNDYDGDVRSLIAPAIGADDLGPNISVTQSEALSDAESTVDLGSVAHGASGSPLTFTITNPGTADLTSLAAGLDGAASTDFTVGALSGSSIPVGSGTVTFTVTFSPSATGVRTAVLHLTNNVASTKNPFDITLTGTGLNAAPVAHPDTLERPTTSRVIKISNSELLTNDTDLDGGDVLSITAVANALPSGATVALIGNFVVYTAPTANSGDGSFTYTLSDGAGGHIVDGTVTVTEVAATGSSPVTPNALQIKSSGSDFILTFLGVPGHHYRVQYTTDAGPPYLWQEFNPAAVITAPATGIFSHTDVNPANPLRLYRAVPHP